MLIAEILHSCRDEGIAAAAVASIGGGFAAALRAEAGRAGLPVGTLTAGLVSRFARDASERDWRDIAIAMAGADHPVLSGLQAMAERGLAAPPARPAPGGRMVPPVPALGLRVGVA